MKREEEKKHATVEGNLGGVAGSEWRMGYHNWLANVYAVTRETEKERRRRRRPTIRSSTLKTRGRCGVKSLNNLKFY